MSCGIPIFESNANLDENSLEYSFKSKNTMQIYHISIIDYLQKYNFNKKVERWFKMTFKGAQP